jgi:hypothetical protein
MCIHTAQHTYMYGLQLRISSEITSVKLNRDTWQCRKTWKELGVLSLKADTQHAVHKIVPLNGLTLP